MSDTADSPETLHRLRRAIRWVLRKFESSRSDEPPYEASWVITFHTTVEHDDVDDLWVAECVDLPGCMSQGHTEEEALENLRDAIKAVLVTRIEERFLAAHEERRQAARKAPPRQVQERTVEVKIAVGA